MKILVVDDKEAVLRQITSFLSGYGHSVETAYNGLDAFEKVQKGDYDLFIIDHLMPVMNGVQLSKNIKSSISYKHIPIIFITTQDQQSIKALPEFELFDAILSKPINVDEFNKCVDQFSIENTLYHSL